MPRFGILPVALLLAIAPCMPVSAQPFTVVVNDSSSVRPVKFSAVAVGNLFGDAGSRDDLFIIGQRPNGLPQASMYRLASRATDFVLVPPRVSAKFSEQVEISLRDVSFGDVVIADMDGNGENDILYTGRETFDISSEGTTYGEFTGIYYNFTAASEAATFRLDESSGLPELSHSRIAVADFDDDGDQDVVIAGNADANSNSDYRFGIYLNSYEVAGEFRPSQTWETDIIPTTIAAGDYDGDGDQDFVIGGSLADGSPVVWLLSNHGDATFSIVPGALPQLYFPAADFGDVDGDGDDELLISGAVLGPTIMRGVTTLYEYESGSLTPRSDVNLPGVFYGSVEFSDYDGDGDSDFLIHGLTDPSESGGQRLWVYRNDGGAFTIRSDVRGTVFGGATWVDYDGNGTREVVVTGERDDQHRIIIYELL